MLILTSVPLFSVGLKWKESPYLFKDNDDRKLPSVAFLKSISTTYVDSPPVNNRIAN
jgi:hypothetical protein